MTHPFDLAEQQIRATKREVDFDIREFTIEHLVYKFDQGDIYIPDYQRDFIWEKDKQSKFIESIILGIPIPFLFLADVSGQDDAEKEGQLEIVDGVQRIQTLSAFVNGQLELTHLDILTTLQGKHFADFSTARRRRFLNASLKLILLSEQSNPDVRFLVFERINSGSVLTDGQKRKGIYRGPFTDFIYNECVNNPLFQKLTAFTEMTQKRGEPAELILRFFAYSDQYPNFYGVSPESINWYLSHQNRENIDIQLYREKFQKMLAFVSQYLPNGFIRVVGTQKTPRVRFEAISVGTLLALQANPDLKNPDITWLNDKKFIDEITGNSTSAPTRIKNRIDFVKNKLLGHE